MRAGAGLADGARRGDVRSGPPDVRLPPVSARTPSEEESATLLDLLHQETRRFEQPAAAPWALAADDPRKPPELPVGMGPPQLAAWTAVARVLLNLDETIAKE